MAEPRLFNDDVREIIFEDAQRIAVELGHREVEHEDLVIATTRAAPTAPVLRHLGIDPSALSQRLLAAAPRGSHRSTTKRPYSTARGRNTMRMWNEARRLGVAEVGAREFLLAMLEPPPRRFLLVFPRRRSPFWAELEAVHLTKASVLRAINEIHGAA